MNNNYLFIHDRTVMNIVVVENMMAAVVIAKKQKTSCGCWLTKTDNEDSN
jgi:hypothetical protein